MKFVATLHSLCCDCGLLKVRWLLLLLALIAGSTFSEEPAPSPRKDNQPRHVHPAKTEKQGTEKNPVFVKVIPSESTNSIAEDDGKKSDEKLSWQYVIEVASVAVTALATIVIAIFTVALACSTKRLWREAKISSRIAIRAARSSKKSADIALKQARILVSSERGYAKMSHCHPLNLEDIPSSIRFKMEIKNWRRTPVQVTALRLFTQILDVNKPLPKYPPYADHDPSEAHAFLVSEEFFYFYLNVLDGNSATEDLRAIRDGKKILYLIGYVEYSDKFGIKRRGGYARRYTPEGPDLIFVTQEHYNYDRTQEGETDPS